MPFSQIFIFFMSMLASSRSSPKSSRARSTATAECVNAIARNRGLQQFNVRGLVKAKAVILWYTIAHNLMRTVALRAEREKVS